jgi:hypothetical protein
MAQPNNVYPPSEGSPGIPSSVPAGAGPQVICYLGSLPSTWQTLAGCGLIKVANIVEFGAIADYFTDNTVAIQAAADSLKNIGGIVFVPPAALCYGVASTVALTSDAYANITIQGQGYSSCIKSLNAIGTNGSTGMIRFHGASAYSLVNVGIANLRVSGYDETTTDSPLVVFTNSAHTFVRDSFADTSRNEGFYWNAPGDSKQAQVTGNYVTHTGGYGSSSVTDYRAAYNTNVGDLVMTGNRSYQVGMAIELTGLVALISGNIFDTCAENMGALPTPCLSLESTGASSYGKIKVLNNVIRNGSVAVSFGANVGENDISYNLIEFCNQGVVSASTTSPDTISGNYFFDTVSGSQSSAITFNGTAGGVAENNTIVTGATQWANAVLVVDATGPVIVRHNTIIGAAVTTRFFDGGDATHTNVEFLNNKIVPGATSAGANRYRFLNVSFSASDLSGIDSDQTVFSVAQPKFVVGAIPSKGAWLVGDGSIDTSTGISSIVTTAGSPGTWWSVVKTVASGATAMGTGAISSAACATTVTAAATGVASTDVIQASFNGDPTGVTGYVPFTTGMLTIIPFPTSGNVNFKVCNNTLGSITPGALTLNWRVER